MLKMYAFFSELLKFGLVRQKYLTWLLICNKLPSGNFYRHLKNTVKIELLNFGFP